MIAHDKVRLHVVALYSKMSGIQLEGSSTEFQRMSEIVRLAKPDMTVEFTSIPADAVAPFDRSLSFLRVSTSDGKVRVSVREESVYLEGSTTSLWSLAEQFSFLAGKRDDDSQTQIPYHVHLEVYDGHPFLAPESESLILMLRPQRETSCE